jgi:hypothetical protein
MPISPALYTRLNIHPSPNQIAITSHHIANASQRPHESLRPHNRRQKASPETNPGINGRILKWDAAKTGLHFSNNPWVWMTESSNGTYPKTPCNKQRKNADHICLPLSRTDRRASAAAPYQNNLSIYILSHLLGFVQWFKGILTFRAKL